MNINRHNYEEYFILYLDNELGSEERRQVELFVQANPDLQEELSMLQQTRLVADESVTFTGKEMLLRHSDSTITLNNYEEWLLLYVDNELTPAQKTEVETFATAHPAIKEELTLLQQVKLQPEETIVFTNKELLYRTEEKVRPVIAMRWRRIAVAAILLLAVSMVSLFIINANKPDVTTGSSVLNKPDTQKIKIITPPLRNPINPPDQIVRTINNGNPSSPDIKKEVAVQSKKTSRNLPADLEKKETNIATTSTQEDTDQPDELAYQPKMKRNTGEPVVSFATLTKVKENTTGALVTSGIHQPSLLTDDASSGSDDTDPSEKKNKLRGFLRKITRTFEKNTNIKATDENDRLLVAGLAIKL